ncbi:phage tail protein, partial [Salmonella enterica]|nr:phage tail protein [Salmonella enterica]
MSKFTTPAILEMLEHYMWRVYEPFEFYLSDDNSDVIE